MTPSPLARSLPSTLTFPVTSHQSMPSITRVVYQAALAKLRTHLLPPNITPPSLFFPPSLPSSSRPLSLHPTIQTSTFCALSPSFSHGFSLSSPSSKSVSKLHLRNSIFGSQILIRSLSVAGENAKGENVAKPETKDRKLNVTSNIKPQFSSFVREEGRTYQSEDTRLLCPGCGVPMQSRNSQIPGFYQMPAVNLLEDKEGEEKLSEEEMAQMANWEEGEGEVEGEAEKEGEKGDMGGSARDGWVVFEGRGKKLVPVETRSVDDFEDESESEDVGFEPLGPEFGPTKAWNDGNEGEEGEEGEERRRGGSKESSERDSEDRLVVCARCHALRNYGKVKEAKIENLLPDFDFDRAVGTRLKRAYGRRAVVVMVIDAADFDGSFPRKAAEVLTEAEEGAEESWKEGQAGNVFRLLVVANKIDLLPKQVSRSRLEKWVRRRARAGGAPRVSGAHLTSAQEGWGVRRLVETIKELAGPRGEVWVVGAQNAGKSSLINAMGREESGGKQGQLTEAALPGTTIGVVVLDNVLGQRRKIFDTPGLLHPHQITTRLTWDEQKFVLPRKVLKPRTFRIKVGNTIHIGGLARVDLVTAPSESIYLTVWASAYVVCHMGKTENAESVFNNHVGYTLKPPSDKDRLSELGPWLPRKISVEGDRWDQSSVDVAIAGLGWVGVGVNGKALLKVWTYEEIAVTSREAMVFDLNPVFEKPGFTVAKLPNSLKEEKGAKKEKLKSR